MKYLKKYENLEFKIDFALSKIKEEFSEDRVCQMLDEEILEWVDDDWSDDYESEYDWYVDHNNDEAEDVVIGQIINWFKSNNQLSEDDYLTLFDAIKNEYTCLN